MEFLYSSANDIPANGVPVLPECQLASQYHLFSAPLSTRRPLFCSKYCQHTSQWHLCSARMSARQPIASLFCPTVNKYRPLFCSSVNSPVIYTVVSLICATVISPVFCPDFNSPANDISALPNSAANDISVPPTGRGSPSPFLYV
jgi:hypothetical protein